MSILALWAEGLRDWPILWRHRPPDPAAERLCSSYPTAGFLREQDRQLGSLTWAFSIMHSFAWLYLPATLFSVGSAQPSQIFFSPFMLQHQALSSYWSWKFVLPAIQFDQLWSPIELSYPWIMTSSRWCVASSGWQLLDLPFQERASSASSPNCSGFDCIHTGSRRSLEAWRTLPWIFAPLVLACRACAPWKQSPCSCAGTPFSARSALHIHFHQ